MTEQEKISKYDLLLQKYIDNKSFIKIYRTVFDKEENLSGFLLGMSKDFMFMQVDSDFTFDGYAIIRKDDFDNIRHSSYERTQRKIFKAEGLLEKGYGFNKHLPLTNWTDIFETLKNYDFHVIIENENKDCLDFWIGQIVKVTDKSVSIHNYNPDGVLDEKPKSIKFNTISIVKFGDNYSMTFRKYLRLKKQR
jgi:hypothetical protein